jgi:hypothetical protein
MPILGQVQLLRLLGGGQPGSILTLAADPTTTPTPSLLCQVGVFEGKVFLHLSASSDTTWLNLSDLTAMANLTAEQVAALLVLLEDGEALAALAAAAEALEGLAAEKGALDGLLASTVLAQLGSDYWAGINVGNGPLAWYEDHDYYDLPNGRGNRLILDIKMPGSEAFVPTPGRVVADLSSVTSEDPDEQADAIRVILQGLIEALTDWTGHSSEHGDYHDAVTKFRGIRIGYYPDEDGHSSLSHCPIVPSLQPDLVTRGGDGAGSGHGSYALIGDGLSRLTRLSADNITALLALLASAPGESGTVARIGSTAIRVARIRVPLAQLKNPSYVDESEIGDVAVNLGNLGAPIAEILEGRLILITECGGLPEGSTAGFFLGGTASGDAAGLVKLLDGLPSSTARDVRGGNGTDPRNVDPNNIWLHLDLSVGAISDLTSGEVLVLVSYLGPTGTAIARTGSLFAPKSNARCLLLDNGKVLATGGFDDNGDDETVSAVCGLYDAGARFWTATGSMGTPREFHTLTKLPDGKVLATGGYATYAVPLGTAEIYDPATGLWTATTGPMGSARAFHTATLLDNGLVLIAGGSADGETALDTAELFDPATGLFSSGFGGLPAPRQFHTATLLTNGKVLLAGGDNGIVNQSTTVLYDPDSSTFAASIGMTVPRGVHSATRLADGRVLLAGGNNGISTEASAEIINADAGATFPVLPMAAPRRSHGACLLADGRVLVTGGFSGANELATAEIFNPSTGQWTPVGNLSSPRDLCIAVAISPNALIVGGSDADANALATCDLYTP